ncbi:uncharacterized protein [Lolium perenne]|uniref:uncharacterized protein n=1 Tax=Lolium perenne TaxID=4522 RepID=UPI003A98F8BE
MVHLIYALALDSQCSEMRLGRGRTGASTRGSTWRTATSWPSSRSRSRTSRRRVSTSWNITSPAPFANWGNIAFHIAEDKSILSLCYFLTAPRKRWEGIGRDQGITDDNIEGYQEKIQSM